MAVRFDLTTNDPWSVDDAFCEGISPLGYWWKINQSPAQTKPYNKGVTYLLLIKVSYRNILVVGGNEARPQYLQ